MSYIFEKITLSPHPDNQRLYGGWLTDFYPCGGKEHCQNISPGDGYMAGQFYFMSPDLTYIVSLDEQERIHPAKGELEYWRDASLLDWLLVAVVTVRLCCCSELKVSSKLFATFFVSPSS